MLTIFNITDTHIDNEDRAGYVNTSFNWIKDNWGSADKNGLVVLHAGDVVNRGYNLDEFQLAEPEMDILFDNDIPLLIAPGNHDYDDDNETDWEAETRGLTRFNDHFGLDKYSDKDWFGGSHGEGAENVYFLLSGGGKDWLFMALEYRPRSSTLDWANGIAADHPNREIVVVTHEYLDGAEEALLRDSGKNIWQNFVCKHGNISIVLCGHCLGSIEGGTHTDGARRFDYNNAGRRVGQFYHNWQAYEHQNNYEDYMGDRGEGRFRKHKWDQDSSVQVESFAPEHSGEEEDYMKEYLTSGRHQFDYTFPMEAKTVREYDYEVEADTYDATEQANPENWLVEGRARIVPPPFPSPGQPGLKFNSTKRTYAGFSSGTYAQADSSVFGTAALSAIMLVKFGSEPSDANTEVLATAFATANSGIRLWVNTSGEMNFRGVYSSSGNWNFNADADFPCDGRWHVVYIDWTGTTDSDGARLFIDDMDSPAATDTAEIWITSHADDLTVGRASDRSERWFPSGSGIAGLAIFDVRIASAADRRRLADLLLNGEEFDCEAYYRMDEGSGSSIDNAADAADDGLTYHSDDWGEEIVPSSWVQFSDRVLPAQVGGHPISVIFELAAHEQPTEENMGLWSTVFSTADHGIRCWLSTAGNLTVAGCHGSSGDWTFILSHGFNFDGNRHVCCFTWIDGSDGGEVRLFVDDYEGAVDSQNADADLNWHSYDLVFGRANDRNERYAGIELANFAVFDKELAWWEREIYFDDLKNGDLIPEDSDGLIHYYPMRKGGGDEVKDTVGSANGKIYGGAGWMKDDVLLFNLMPFIEPYWTEGYTSGTRSVDYKDDHIELEVSGSDSQINLRVDNAIDLGDFSEIMFEFEVEDGSGAIVQLGVFTSTGQQYMDASRSIRYLPDAQGHGRRVHILKTGVSGTNYPGFGIRRTAAGSSKLKVYNVTLLK